LVQAIAFALIELEDLAILDLEIGKLVSTLPGRAVAKLVTEACKRACNCASNLPRVLLFGQDRDVVSPRTRIERLLVEELSQSRPWFSTIGTTATCSE
jgi:hypothetical protein